MIKNETMNIKAMSKATTKRIDIIPKRDLLVA